MFQPIGSQRASVYWRRRALVIAALALLVITIWVLAFSGKSKPTASGSTPEPPPTHSSVSAPSTPAPSTSTSASQSSPVTSSSGASSTAPPGKCDLSKLRISAVSGAATYPVGARPDLMLQVVNPGPQPCVQDLADSQVELVVYNGESRVWGSHDCEIQPGTDPRTLTVGQSVRVSITWSGLSSQPQCAGTRQRVGAGTYTLYAKLAGQTGTAAQFTIT